MFDAAEAPDLIGFIDSRKSNVRSENKWVWAEARTHVFPADTLFMQESIAERK